VTTTAVTAFAGGIDRRLPPIAGMATQRGRLYDAVNVDISEGGTVIRRQPLRFRYACNTAIKGLAHAFGKLHGWHGLANAPTDEVPGSAVFTLHGAHVASKSLKDVVFAQPYAAGKMYAVTQYDDDTFAHWYSDTAVADSNCPQSGVVAIVGGRVFAWDGTGDTLRFSAHDDPTNWTGTDNAGFLPVGRYSGGQGAPTAVGTWRGNLAVFFATQIQVWDVRDPDPTEHALLTVLDGTGCEHPYTTAAVDETLLYLSPAGYRTITAASYDGRPIIDSAIGEPVDLMVRDEGRQSWYRGVRQKAVYSQAFRSYFNLAVGARRADVLRFNAGSPAWTTYHFPSPIDWPVARGGGFWFRNLESGSIVSMDTALRYELGADFRDQTGPPMTTAFDTHDAADVTAAFSHREGASAQFVAANSGGTPTDGAGPSADTNARPFAYWPVPTEEPYVVLTLADGVVRPQDVDDTVDLSFDYCAQGGFGPQGAAIVEASDTDDGDDWYAIGTLPGWDYAADRRGGDDVTDASGNSFTVSVDGGWRTYGVVKPSRARRVRVVMRANAPSAGSGVEGYFVWGARVPSEDLAYPDVARATPYVPERYPTNLAVAVAFSGWTDGPVWYIPGLGGGDVPLRTASVVAAEDAESIEHQMASGGTWTAAPAMFDVLDLAPVTTDAHLTYTVGSDGFIPAGDLSFTPTAGGRWHETYARSRSVCYDAARMPAELLVVSGNGREFRPAVAATMTPATARVRVERYDATSGARLTPDLVFEVPCRDTYEASVGVYWLAVDGTNAKWYLAAESSRMVHRYTRGPGNDVAPVLEASFPYPATTAQGTGIAAGDGAVYWLTFPNRRLYRYDVPSEAWLGYRVEYGDGLQSRSQMVLSGNRLYVYDTPSRTIRVVEVRPLPSGAAGGELALHGLTARTAAAVPYDIFVRLPFLTSSRGRSQTLKEWQGVRIEQYGQSKVDFEYWPPGEVDIQTTERVLMRGDDTGRSIVPIGVVAPEISPRFHQDEDWIGRWELVALYLESIPHATWSTL